MQLSPTVEPMAARQADLTDLAAELSGDLVLPDSPAFAEASGIWNVHFQGTPAAIVRAADAHDVARAVRFATAAGLEIAVRSGGHSVAGHSTGDGVLVIDLRALRGLHVDPATRMVHAGTGLTARDVTESVHPHGLAIPFGDTGSVGIAGLTLGAGIGYLARKHGLAIDRLRSVELVTAAGEIVTASADEHPDLFWAVRGGGGNFGIVTRFVYEAVELGPTYLGGLFLPLSEEVLRGMIRLAEEAPDELTIIANIMPTPPAPFIAPEAVGTPSIGILLVHAGDPAEGERVVARFKALATPIGEALGAMPYPEIYAFSEEAELPAPGTTRSFFTDALDDDALRRIVERSRMSDAPEVLITQIRVFGGEMGRVAPEATAFAHRDARIMWSAFTIHANPERVAEERAFTEAYYAEMAPAATGVYVNFLEDEGEARIRQAYPEATLRRLAEVKATWDPGNVFHRNQNVRPA